MFAYLSTMQDVYHKLEFRDSRQMLPKLLFKGKFSLSDEDLEELIADGEVFVTTVDGRLRYCWQQTSAD